MSPAAATRSASERVSPGSPRARQRTNAKPGRRDRVAQDRDVPRRDAVVEQLLDHRERPRPDDDDDEERERRAAVHDDRQRESGGIVRSQRRRGARYFRTMVHGLLAFVAVSAVVICTPGQDTAVTIRSTLAGGRRAGIATAVGITLGIATWTIAASVGVVALLQRLGARLPRDQAGRSGLPRLPRRTLAARRRARARARERERSRDATLAPRRAFRQGLVSNLGNPKIAVFFASLLPQFVPAGTAPFVGFSHSASCSALSGSSG